MIEPTYTYKAMVVKVIDADTVDLLVDLGFAISNKIRIRLLGIDAPEMRTDEGKAAKVAVMQKMPVGASVIVRTFKRAGDKYGRWLARVYMDEVDIAEWLVENGLAVRAFTD